MEDVPPSLDEWRQLYEVMAQIKELAPWRWMWETNLFAVEDPESGELGYVSVMGQAGEHFAVAVYRGVEGLGGFLVMQQAEDWISPDVFLNTPQLQASFEDRDQLEVQDRDTIKFLGLKFRGRRAWPMFRSFRPGFHPWFLSAEEVRFLTHALQQVLEVAPRFEEDQSVLHGDDVSKMLVRTPRPTDSGIIWYDEYRPMKTSISQDLFLEMDWELLEELKAAPRQKMTIETDLFMLPTPLRQGKGRPYYPFMLLLVDGRSGFVIGFELLHVDRRMQDMWAKVPLHVALKLADLGAVPTVIKARRGVLADLLQSLSDDLDITLKPSSRLRMLDEAKRSLLMTLG